jgi:hypothetical protein
MWREYQVPAREDDRAIGLRFSDVRADEITDGEYRALPPEVQAEVDEDLDAMDAEAVAEAIGADHPAKWRDHEHGRDTERPVAAE